MPFVSGFLAAASFYFDIRAAYFSPDRVGTILTGFSDNDLFDNPFLLADHRFLARFPDLCHCFGISIPVADRAVDRASLHHNSLIMQLNRLFHRFFNDAPVNPHPRAFDLAFADR
jgi:hypothetical protein